jgi:N-ethylmaleimide reductase
LAAYVHFVVGGDAPLLADLRPLWKHPLILNRAGRPRDQVGTDLTSGLADLEAYGQMILANPDFMARLKKNSPMNEADRASFFGGGAQGYTYYPSLDAATSA